MTQPFQYFNALWLIVSFSLPFGCDDAPSSQEVIVHQQLQTLRTHSEDLEAQAFQIESQIDEVRRATPDNWQEEVRTLQSQFETLKQTHIRLQQEMVQLRKALRTAD